MYTSTACVFSCGSFLWFSTAVVYLIKEKSTQTCVRSFLFFMYSAVRYVIGGRAVDSIMFYFMSLSDDIKSTEICSLSSTDG